MNIKKKEVIYGDCQLEVTGVTLLSVEEARQLPIKDRDIGYCWWLRSPGGYASHAAGVDYYGHVSLIGMYVDNYHYGIRPALQIENIECSNLQIGDVFELGDYQFKIISEDKALCTTSIGRCAFRESLEDDNANVYEVSDIKKYVDAWFKTLYICNNEESHLTIEEFKPLDWNDSHVGYDL